MFIINLVKGFFIGIAFIIPGLSGGTLAIYLGVYQPLLHAISNIFKDFKKHFLFLLPIGIGIVFSIVLFAKLLGLFLNLNSFITLLFFIGLLLGGLKQLTKQIQEKPQKWSFYLAFVAFSIVLGLFLMEQFSSLDTNPTTLIPMSIGNTFLLIFLGALTATTMIVPGVSGSALLMVLGFYTAIVTNVMGNLFDFSLIGYHLYVVASFGVGGVIGIFLLSSVLDKALTKYPSECMVIILGFLFASAIVLFLQIKDPQTAILFDYQQPIYHDYWQYISQQWLSVLFGIITATIGFVLARKMSLLDQMLKKS